MLNSLLRFSKFVVALIVSLLIISCNARLYSSPPETNDYQKIDALLNEYEINLKRGLAHEMQWLFPEGYYFSYVLYGLSRVNLGLQGVDHERMLVEARVAYEALDSDAGRKVFSSELDPPYGIFYQGWRNYLLAGILLLQETPNPDELARFQTESAQIAGAIAASPHPFLPSYHNQVWPVDTFPAIVSLRAYTILADDRYELLIADWLTQINTYRDTETGLLPHKINAQTGEIIDGTRATSQTLMLRFLAELDPAQAVEEYALFRTQFVVNKFGFPGVREFPMGVWSFGDIDSGPLISGVSLSATAVMLGTARMVGDDPLVERLWISAETVGIPAPTPNGRFYLAASPVAIGNIFAAWSASSQPWLTAKQPSSPFPANTLWRVPLHITSILTLLVIYWFIFRIPQAHEPRFLRLRSAFQPTR